MKRFVVGFVALSACFGVSCASVPGNDPVLPGFLRGFGNSKYQLSGSRVEFLVVDIDSHQRTALERVGKGGTVAVRYTGCNMEILPRCEANGGFYYYESVNPKDDLVEITDNRSLYAKIPLGAASLESKLRQAGQLFVNTIIVGRYENNINPMKYHAFYGVDCHRATHYIQTRTTGAFVFRTASKGDVSAGAKGWTVQAEAEWNRNNLAVSRDGNREACEQSTGRHSGPPQNCSATIGVTLVRIREANGPSECE